MEVDKSLTSGARFDSEIRIRRDLNDGPKRKQGGMMPQRLVGDAGMKSSNILSRKGTECLPS
jgi:hypothetical protein